MSGYPRAEDPRAFASEGVREGGAADPFVQVFPATTSPRQPEQRQLKTSIFEVAHLGVFSNRQLMETKDPKRSRVPEVRYLTRCLTLRQ